MTPIEEKATKQQVHVIDNRKNTSTSPLIVIINLLGLTFKQNNNSVANTILDVKHILQVNKIRIIPEDRLIMVRSKLTGVVAARKHSP